jgi:glucokinase-like ROK family protein
MTDPASPTAKSGNKRQPPRLNAPIVVNSMEFEIIRSLRVQEQLSRTDIAHITGWSKAKTSQEVGRLIEKGYLREVGDGPSEGGRRPRLLSINNRLGYVVGIDIGATSKDLALADICGQIVQRRSEPADVLMAPEEVLGRCSEIVCEMALAQGGHPDQVLGIGLGVPGPVEFSRGVLVAPPLMPGWEEFSIRGFFQTTFPTAFVAVDNDVNIMALGELRAGDGIGLDNLIYVKIGTGIGAGIVSNGRMHRGSSGSAGDIGHICVDKSGAVCRCGNIGCLEAMAAGPAIAEKAAAAARSGASEFLRQRLEANQGKLSPEDVNAACRSGDTAALEIVRQSGQMIGDVLAGLVNFYNPSHIFIGGGIANFGNHLLATIRQGVLQRSLPLSTRNLVIDYSRMGSEAGVTGATFLALEYLFLVEDSHTVFAS